MDRSLLKQRILLRKLADEALKKKIIRKNQFNSIYVDSFTIQSKKLQTKIDALKDGITKEYKLKNVSKPVVLSEEQIKEKQQQYEENKKKREEAKEKRKIKQREYLKNRKLQTVMDDTSRNFGNLDYCFLCFQT